MKNKLKRFGVAIQQDLLLKFDDYIKNKNYKNRSEAIRDLMRAAFIEENVRNNKEVAGVISIVYDHHKRELVDKIVDIQHEFQDIIAASQHIHLDKHHCLEVIITRGVTSKIKELADKLGVIKGVLHKSLSFTSVI